MAYASWSVVFGEQPSAAKWNILGTNDASFNDGTGLNAGSVQQIQSTLSTAVATGSTTIPVDNTIPQITEGDQYMTLAITPKATTNLLFIRVVAFVGSQIANNITGALFQDATANALSAAFTRQTGAPGATMLVLQHTMTAGTTSATTFRFRAGVQSADTLTFNGSNTASLFGAINKSSIVITEHKV